jgi:serine/threonine protein kinase
VVAVPALERADLVASFANEAIRALPGPGDIVDGFRLEAILGEGRYTRVLRAQDGASGKTVVLKFPKPLVGAEAPMREAFVRESWIASRVRSPFVGEVLPVDGERQSRLYLALPFYEGETLESRLTRRPLLSLTAGLDIAQKLARGVAALHRAGVIHRDIKPDNVILQPAPGPGGSPGLKLIDFGLARERGGGPTDAAEPGTPSFLAPELFEGRPADERSDQFALGVTIYRLFTSGYPYGEIEPFSHPKFRVPASLTAARPDLPAWLDRVIRRAIAVDPQERYHDVLEFMFELEHGADRASPIEVLKKPLYERSPVLFWQVVSAVLVLALLLAASWGRRG